MPRPWRCLDVILAVVLICGGVLVDAATPPSAAEPAARTNWSATTSTCMSFFDLPERDVKQALLNAGLNGAVRELLSEVLHDPHGQGVPTLPQDALVRQVRTLLHLQGTPAFDAGEDFGQACVHLQVSVTADDMALFQSTKIAGRRVCATPEEAPSVQQLASTKATLDALYTYNPALRSIPPARVLPLLRHVDLTGGVHGSSYCLAATGVVYPIEVRVMAGNLQPPPLDITWPLSQPPTFTNSIGMAFVLVPPGGFTMGSAAPQAKRDERPLHTVRIRRPFYLSAYEVTQTQWQAVMGKNPSHFKGNLKYPVDNVSWRQVHRFMKRLHKREGGPPYRLPTEAEWEYAARAGSTSLYSFGDDASQLGRYAWYKVNANNSIQPVGSKQPNAWGLYDMLGNVWEWVQDRYGPYAPGQVTDPQGPKSGTTRVFRGCSWSSPLIECRTTNRESLVSRDRSEGYIGFRLLREIP